MSFPFFLFFSPVFFFFLSIEEEKKADGWIPPFFPFFWKHKAGGQVPLLPLLDLPVTCQIHSDAGCAFPSFPPRFSWDETRAHLYGPFGLLPFFVPPFPSSCLFGPVKVAC